MSIQTKCKAEVNGHGHELGHEFMSESMSKADSDRDTKCLGLRTRTRVRTWTWTRTRTNIGHVCSPISGTRKKIFDDYASQNSANLWHQKLNKVTSMLVTDVGDQMCWWQNLDVGDKSHHQHRELGTNIKYQSPTSHSGVLWCWWPM